NGQPFVLRHHVHESSMAVGPHLARKAWADRDRHTSAPVRRDPPDYEPVPRQVEDKGGSVVGDRYVGPGTEREPGLPDGSPLAEHDDPALQRIDGARTMAISLVTKNRSGTRRPDGMATVRPPGPSDPIRKASEVDDLVPRARATGPVRSNSNEGLAGARVTCHAPAGPDLVAR